MAARLRIACGMQHFPLVPEDRRSFVPGRAAVNALVRAATAHLLTASGSKAGYPSEVAAARWPGDSDTLWLTKAAVSPATTGSVPVLLSTLLVDFLTTLGPVSAGAQLLSRGLQLSFAGNAVIQVPRIVADAAGVDFAAEGSPIAVRQLLAGGLTLSPRKFATISTFTGELLQHSIPNVQVLVRQVLTESVALALDAALLGSTAGDATRPAGLRYGIAALTPSGATTVEAMIADVSALVSVVSGVAGNSPIVLVASPSRAMKLHLRAPRDLPLEVLASSAVNSDELIAIASNAVASAMDPIPRFTASTEALLHQDDTAPLPISATGSPNTIAAPVRSLWQTDVVGLRMIMEVAWGLRHASGLAWIDNITAW